jgi:hypothetical protein
MELLRLLAFARHYPKKQDGTKLSGVLFSELAAVEVCRGVTGRRRHVQQKTTLFCITLLLIRATPAKFNIAQTISVGAA